MTGLVRPLFATTALLLLAGLFASDRPRPVLYAQAGPLAAPVVVQASRFGISSRIADLPEPDLKSEEEIASTPPETVPLRTFRTELPDAKGSLDPVVQSSLPETPAIPSPSLTFEGIGKQDSFIPGIGRVLPPGTVGDVGPNHYVQMVNSLFRIWDKAGNPLTAPRKVSDLFASLGAPCGTSNEGDPIVRYDGLADRWLLSEFCTVANPNTRRLIAISQTGDPTGAYFLYDFMMPNDTFNDYQKFGVWPDGYYMSDNQFNQAGTAFLGAGVFAFDRAKMLAGDPTASYLYFDLALLDATIGGMLPSDLDGLTPPPLGRPNTFAYFTAGEFGDPQGDAIRVFDFHADFANPGLSTFTERAESPVAVAAFDPRSPAGPDDIEQPPAVTTSEALDAISDRLMHRLQYRSFGARESLVVTHTVNVTPVVGTVTQANHQAGVRYYELRRESGGASFGVHEQATFAPDVHNRWMGSAAMDHQGNLAVGYSVSSTTVPPSIRYAGRLSTDTPGGLMQGEATPQAGAFVQMSTTSRRGDYSSLNVDPSDDCTFWYTNEHYQADNPAAEWQTRIGKFSFSVCSPAPKGTLQGVVSNTATGLPIPGAVVVTSNGYHRSTAATGDYSMAAAPDSYDVMASAAGYEPATVIGVVVTNGATTVQSFALNPMPSVRVLCCSLAGGAPVVEAAPPAVVTAESCRLGGGNGAPDPNETVTVELPLRNVGGGPTSNLVATLLPGNGVNAPSGSQSYGVLSPGGPLVSRPFTFVASGTCGGTVKAALHLQDGAVDLGTVTFNLTTGGDTASSTTTFANPASIIIPATGTGVPTGAPAAPYPSTIDVSGVTGRVSKVTVRLADFTHTFPDDIDVLLVGPGGQKFVLMSDAGGGPDLVNVTLTFDDGATQELPDFSLIASGVYRPTNYGGIDPFPPPAPAPPYLTPAPAGDATLASVLNGDDPNGTWSLYVVDDARVDIGSIAGGWSLSITTAVPVCCEQGCTLACPADIVASNDAQMCLAVVSYAAPIAEGSCGVVATAPASGSAFPVGVTTVTSTATRFSDGGTTACSFTVTVNDGEPPAISGESVDTPTLWSPDHRMVDVTVSYDTSDNCGPVTTALSVTSNEPINGTGDGDTVPDWEVVDNHHVRLRAERAGTGTGRIYTITITATDSHGHSSQRVVTVTAPHDQGP